MTITVDASQILETFKKLPDVMQKKVLVKSTRKGAVEVQKQAKVNAKAFAEKEFTGVMVKNIVVNKFKNKDGMLRFAIRIRPKAVNERKRDKNGNPVRVGLYAAVLEYGKANQPPRPWLRNAAISKKDDVLRVITESIKLNLDAAVRDAKT